MCFAQRHIKRLLAYSTISHMGLLVIAFALLVPQAGGGLALYLFGHGCFKAALFMAAGMLLHHLGSIDELKLRGRGKEAITSSAFFIFLALGLSGVPPYGTFIGEAMIDSAAEKLHYSWISYIFMLAGLITAAAVLRVAGRVFFGWGDNLDESQSEEGETDEGRETQGGNVPPTMWAPVLVLLLLGIAITFVPQIRERVDSGAMRFFDQAAYQSEVLYHGKLPQYTPDKPHPLLPGIIRGIVTTILAFALAGFALFRKKGPLKIFDFSSGFTVVLRPLRIIHSGHVGDYVAWLTFGVAAIGGVFAFYIH
jgi:multicomponent Na+:H+ antiporter subunit D